MGALPTSDMPGYRQLHDRVATALDRCHETRSVDFKESAKWDDIRTNLIRTAMAMGNLRDGGIIVIGVSERNETWELEGITPEVRATYDVDTVTDAVNKYCSPEMNPELVCVNYRDGKEFLVIHIHEFDISPYVCKRDGPDRDQKFYAGSVLIRPPGKPQTKRASNAHEIHDLLELAAEKRTRSFVETAFRVGFSIEQTSQLFDKELGEL